MNGKKERHDDAAFNIFWHFKWENQLVRLHVCRFVFHWHVPARGGFACGMTFLLLAGVCGGLNLTFVPHPGRSSAFPCCCSAYHYETREQQQPKARLDVPVKQRQDDTSAVQTRRSHQSEHSDGFANCLASSHIEIAASDKTDTQVWACQVSQGGVGVF